jgi:hypothetical protein
LAPQPATAPRWPLVSSLWNFRYSSACVGARAGVLNLATPSSSVHPPMLTFQRITRQTPRTPRTTASSSSNSEVFTWSRGLWLGLAGPCGHSGTQLASPSVFAIEGGPGPVLDCVLDVPRHNVHQDVDCRHVLSILRRLVGLLEPALLGKHVGNLFLMMFTRVLTVGVHN